MVAEVQFELEGLAPVLKRLETLPPKLARKGFRTAVRKGANVVRKAARENAKRIDDPQSPRQIWKNIAVQFSSRESKRQGGIVMRVGVRGGARKYAGTVKNVRSGRAGKTYRTGGDKTNPGGDTWYWRFIEFGTSRTRAKPFLRPALSTNIQSATNAVTRSLDEEITKALREPL